MTDPDTSPMTFRTTGALAAFAAAFASPAAAQITHQHVASLASANGKGEIVAFDKLSGRFFMTNPDTDSLDVFTYANGALTLRTPIALAGQPTSVDVHDGLVAVAIIGMTRQSPGKVFFFDAETGQASGNFVMVGALPDMLTFTPDGSKVVVANEGEADEFTGLTNPEGSVSIVDVATRTVTTAGFAPWNGQKNALKAAGVRLQSLNGISLAQDVEPEYLAINAAGDTAYVTLQENNSLAIVDLATATVLDIVSCGEKDHSVIGNEFDASNADGIHGNFQNWSVKGLFMPDGICTFSVGGVEYLATANEGDSRAAIAGFSDEMRGSQILSSMWHDIETASPNTSLYTVAELNDVAALGRLKMAMSPYDRWRGDVDGDGDVDQLYSFGGRSVSIWDTAGNLVFDSGDTIERAMMTHGLWKESRSDDKGPEPEAVVFGDVGGVPYLFVALERTNAICVFDVSNPSNATLADVIDIPGESATSAFRPEGLEFLDASESPLGVDTLAMTSEFGGILSLFSLSCNSCAAGSSYGVGCKSLELTSSVPNVTGSLDLLLENAEGNFAIFVFGETAVDPGYSLAGVGAPGCYVHTSGNLKCYTQLITAGAASFSMPMLLTPSLIGCEVTAQAAAYTPHNAIGLATSNGILARVGL